MSPAGAAPAFPIRQAGSKNTRSEQSSGQAELISAQISHAAELLPKTSDFAVEIGAAPSFDKLPGTIPRRPRKKEKKLCADCHQRRAVFHYRGRVRYRKDHDLCPECHRALMNRVRRKTPRN